MTNGGDRARHSYLAPQARVCIIGGGAGGLSAATYLKDRGYQRVTVLERAPRVGGLCESFTYDRLGFDLGGNYVMPGFDHVRALARRVDAALVGSPSRIVWDHTMNGGRGGFRSVLQTVLQGTTPWAFAEACVRYRLLLLRYRDLVDSPGLRDIHEYPVLCQPFARFLASEGLDPLRRLFAIPLSIMGYGSPGRRGQPPEDAEYLDRLPTIYALKYVDASTFQTLLAVGMGLSNEWPRRFADGYERLWERLSWTLDVRRGVNVEAVRRDGGVRVEYTRSGSPGVVREDYDALILACPPPATLGFLDASAEERDLYGAFQYNEYCVTTAVTEGMRDHIVDVLPLTDFGRPWAMVKQWPGSDLCVYYSPVSPEVSDEEVVANIREDAARVGGRVTKVHSQRRWKYFPHVTSERMGAGFYRRLEALQGDNRTFTFGNSMDFELAEKSAAYSKARVEDFFPALLAGVV